MVVFAGPQPDPEPLPDGALSQRYDSPLFDSILCGVPQCVVENPVPEVGW